MTITGQTLLLSLFGLAVMSLIAATSAVHLTDLLPTDVAAAALAK